MATVKRVYSQPNASSLKEGEEVVYLGQGKPLARYRKEGGQVWVSYMTTNGNLFVEKDFNVQGTISQGGSGGGSGPPIVKGGLIEQTAGGVGVSTAGTTGAVNFNSGTPSVGTLPVESGGTAVTTNATWINSNITTSADGTLNYDGTTAVAPSLPSISGTLTVAKGGTGETDSNTWLNSRIQMNTNGTLDYSASGSGAVTMNTLTDANNIRARVTAGLDSSGDVQRVVEPEYGGLGADFSGDNTGFIKISNGTASQRSYADAKSDMSLNNVANVDTTNADNISSGTLATARHSAHVTDNLDANGLVAGRNLGDGLEAVIIWTDAMRAGSSAGDTPSASTIWVETSTSAVLKITFNYLHDAENKTVKIITNALNRGGTATTTTVTGGLFAMSAAELAASATGSVISSGTGTTNSTTFVRVAATIDVSDDTKFTANVLYKGHVSLHTSNGSHEAKMTGCVVLAYGS